ncbi:hypothetical protein [Mycobacterium sp. JS623]|uniref:hypothetical protein n=1 Tax=Mycobacterium sp. JS623 TaxID=212767 RepID=UPI0012FC4F7F|nr:hypothetical protein [Mycobacterium sp. JS623]
MTDLAAATAVVGAAGAMLSRRFSVAGGVVVEGHRREVADLVWRRSGLYHASIHSKIAWGS